MRPFQEVKCEEVLMTQSHRRYGVLDKVWALLKDHLPGWGGVATDNRQSRYIWPWMCMVCWSESCYTRYRC